MKPNQREINNYTNVMSYCNSVKEYTDAIVINMNSILHHIQKTNELRMLVKNMIKEIDELRDSSNEKELDDYYDVMLSCLQILRNVLNHLDEMSARISLDRIELDTKMDSVENQLDLTFLDLKTKLIAK